MKLDRIVLALLLGLGVVACGGGGGGSSTPPPAENPPPDNGSDAEVNVVRGIVTESGTGKRLAGVQVSVGDETVTTDASGAYAVDAPAGKESVVSFSLAGYAPGFEKTRVDGDAEALLINLKKQGSLQDYNAGTTKTIYQTTEVGPYAVIFQPTPWTAPTSICASPSRRWIRPRKPRRCRAS